MTFSAHSISLLPLISPDQREITRKHKHTDETTFPLQPSP